MQKKDMFDYVLIETTGLANPAPIASSFWLDEDLLSSLYLDAIVTVAGTSYAGFDLESVNNCQIRGISSDTFTLKKMSR